MPLVANSGLLYALYRTERVLGLLTYTMLKIPEFPDLPGIGKQSVVSAVLNGKRHLNIKQVKAPARRNVPMDVFVADKLVELWNQRITSNSCCDSVSSAQH